MGYNTTFSGVVRVPFKTVDHVPEDWPVEGRNPVPEEAPNA